MKKLKERGVFLKEPIQLIAAIDAVPNHSYNYIEQPYNQQDKNSEHEVIRGIHLKLI